ncbi:MAG: PH domain-containing protein [Idiomarina sp.]|nr:PH domain-containing protein [Idiomarina sp.]
MEIDRSAQWQRLHIASLLFFFLQALREVLRAGIQLIPALVAGLVILRDFLHLAIWVALGVIVVILVTMILRYLRFQFTIEPERVRIRSGVVKRLELSLDFERVQQAEVQRPIYLRPFGLCSVRFDSAGSSKQEVILPALRQDVAEDLQRAVRQAGFSADVVTAEDAGAAEQDLAAADMSFSLPLREVSRIGITQNPWVLAAAMMGLIFSNSLSRDWFVEHLVSVTDTWLPSDGHWAIGLLAALVITALVLGVAVVILSTLFFVNKYYGYHFVRHGQRYTYTAGLLTEVNRSFALRKLQTVTVRQGIFARMMRRWVIDLSQAGGARAEKFSLPIVDVTLRGQIQRELGLPEAQWQGVHPWFVVRYILFIAAALGLAFESWWVFGVGVLLMTALRWVYWRRYGWHYDGHWLGVRAGMIGQVEWWLPAQKTQGILYSQSPWQKWLGIANVRVSSASGSIVLYHLPVAKAQAIATDLTDVTKACDLRWM